MSPRSEEDFNIQMKLSLVGIGALLSSEDGYTKVEKIIPGGPADRDGRLKPTDRIISVAQDSGEYEDIIDMPLNKVVTKIRGKKSTKVRLMVLEGSKGQQAIPKEIIITRGIVKLKDSEASSKIREIPAGKNQKLKIGILKLPSFYYDFQGSFEGKKDFKSSTRDVKKILQELNKKNINGLVVDLRSNGGGSLKEAIDLTGLFIKEGPVVQTRNSRGYVRVENDTDSACYYNGPLLILVDRMSASAAEIFAGAIQDYGRGIVVGEKMTHGKGTVQTVFDLRNIFSHFKLKFQPGSIKLTNAKFYRISGSSTQSKGITPDISFESFTDHMEIGENKLENSLSWDKIPPADYKKVDKIRKNIPELKKRSTERRNENKSFQKLSRAIKLFQKIKEKKVVSLNEKKRWKEYLEEKKLNEEQKALFKLDNVKLLKRMEGKKSTEDTKDFKDIFLDEGIAILADSIAIQKERKNKTVHNNLNKADFFKKSP